MTAVADDGTRITPTAHYTSDVWVRYGLSDPALSTPFGAMLHAALTPLNATYGLLSGRPDLDAMLVSRHRALDVLLERAISAKHVGQVLEIAAGLSARGWRFTRRFPDVRYVETDLPPMARHKRRVLDRAGLRGPNHDVRPLDALASDGAASLGAVVADLDPSRGLAIVTEGQLSYLAREDVLAMWRRIATTLKSFPDGLYLSDLHLAGDVDGMWIPEVFRVGLELFARGPVRYHFASADEAVASLRAAGFRDAVVNGPYDVVAPGQRRCTPAPLIRVLSAAT